MILTNDFVFIHFPKNGGSFVTECLNHIYDGTGSKHREKKFSDYFHYFLNPERTNYSIKYMSKALEYTGERIKTQHQGCDEIPKKHRAKPILSVIRNPFDRYVSLYKFGWWKRHPLMDENKLMSAFPSFPDLTFSQYLDLVLNYRLEITKSKNNIDLDVGVYSLHYIKLFSRNYQDILSSIDSIDELDDDYFYKATFLNQGNLREDLFQYLKKLGWPKQKLEIIFEHQKVNTSRADSSYEKYYNQEDIDLIKQKEALIFRLFPHYSFRTSMIPVTQPFLPPEEEYQKLLSEIWDRNWLTNNGPLVQQLEKRLVDYLDVPYLSFVSNGTIAQQIAMKALELDGEVITTPFSYVATTSSIIWENYSPVFVDIDPETFNLDPSKIEAAITANTSAIVATHVYGNPCDIKGIKEVADKHGLKVIYDAAHCFGTTYNGKSVFNYGDVSVTSFHATKLYHTVEGGALITNNKESHEKFNLMRNFGHDGLNNFTGVGINGKNSEFHAAMGLINLNYIDEVLTQRKKLSRIYDDQLEETAFKKQKIEKSAGYNFAYYPVLFENEEHTKKVLNKLKENDIQARRYFYPLLSKLDYVNGNTTPIAEKISRCILCLPLYHELSAEEITDICRIIKDV